MGGGYSSNVIDNPTYNKIEEYKSNGQIYDQIIDPPTGVPKTMQLQTFTATDGHYETPTLPTRKQETEYEYEIGGGEGGYAVPHPIAKDYEVPSLTLRGQDTSVVIINSAGDYEVPSPQKGYTNEGNSEAPMTVISDSYLTMK